MKLDYKLVLSAGLLAIAVPMTAVAVPVVVAIDEDFTIRRNFNDSPRVESNIHPKQSSGSNTDRYALLTFDSVDFGPDVTAASFEIVARNDSVFASGTWTFTLHGVIDGDPQDEIITEGTYDPDGAGSASLFRDDDTMIDPAQVTTFGTFTATTGSTVNFSDPDLLAFLQADTNDVVTLVVTRNTQSGSNTVFVDGSAKLNLEVVPEPSSLALLGLGSLLIARRRRG